jgi:hypothetical protein
MSLPGHPYRLHARALKSEILKTFGMALAGMAVVVVGTLLVVLGLTWFVPYD